MSLLELFGDLAKNRDRILECFNTDILPDAIKCVNSQFAFRRLAKLGRADEPLPTDPKQLSSYRTRLGTMLEYSIGSEIDRIIREGYGDAISLTHAVAHEYPDFYIRGPSLAKTLRIEMKAVDCESDEQAARFDAPTSVIDADADFVLFVGWEWKKETTGDTLQWEHPHIFAYVFVPAMELARERDIRLYQIGGRIENGRVLVPSTKDPGKYVEDKGNYGKIWRIIHTTRAKSSLSPQMSLFAGFLEEVEKHAPERIGRRRAKS